MEVYDKILPLINAILYKSSRYKLLCCANMGYAAKLGSSSVFKITGLTLAGQTAFNTQNQITITNGKVNDYYLYHGSGSRVTSFSVKSGFTTITFVRDNGARWGEYSNLGSSVAILLCTNATMKIKTTQYGYVVWHIDY